MDNRFSKTINDVNSLVYKHHFIVYNLFLKGIYYYSICFCTIFDPPCVINGTESCTTKKLHCVQKKSNLLHKMYNRNVKSERILSKFCVLDAEVFCEKIKKKIHLKILSDSTVIDH